MHANIISQKLRILGKIKWLNGIRSLFWHYPFYMKLKYKIMQKENSQHFHGKGLIPEHLMHTCFPSILISNFHILSLFFVSEVENHYTNASKQSQFSHSFSSLLKDPKNKVTLRTSRKAYAKP